jgi:hypothetical protein
VPPAYLPAFPKLIKKTIIPKITPAFPRKLKTISMPRHGNTNMTEPTTSFSLGKGRNQGEAERKKGMDGKTKEK